jgi:hypothetical protein
MSRADLTTLPKIDLVKRLQNGLIAHATDGKFGDAEYQEIRLILMRDPTLLPWVPEVVRQNSDIGQFWGFIKYEYATYRERRRSIWDAFRPLIDYIESEDRSPGVAPITAALKKFDPENVHAVWQKALDRRHVDPEGAITAARTLLETTCKHILDTLLIEYPDDGDLPKLWSLTAEQLNLTPNQHQQQVFKAILGNVQAVVNQLAAVRNRVGDAHGHGRRAVKPRPRHAELAVNLAGTMAAFLVATFTER